MFLKKVKRKDSKSRFGCMLNMQQIMRKISRKQFDMIIGSRTAVHQLSSCPSTVHPGQLSCSRPKLTGQKQDIRQHVALFCRPLVPQESWASDLNQVRELMTTFIDDTMRKTNDPEFTVSEVFCSVGLLPHNTPPRQTPNVPGKHLPTSEADSSSSSSASSSPRRTLCGMRSSPRSATWTWTTRCPTTGSTRHTTREYEAHACTTPVTFTRTPWPSIRS